jgi:hypothetical protein
MPFGTIDLAATVQDAEDALAANDHQAFVDAFDAAMGDNADVQFFQSLTADGFAFPTATSAADANLLSQANAFFACDTGDEDACTGF